MSVLIRGMEMPKGCAFCRLGKRNGKKMVCPLCDEEWDIHDPMSADHRLDNCPLVPVPPHGKLIDADALIEKCEEMADKEDGNQLDALVLLRWFLEQNAPTVIPTEEGE